MQRRLCRDLVERPMNIELLLPERFELSLDTLAQRLHDLTLTTTPFSRETLAFTKRLSTLLLTNRQAEAYPSLRALGFWLRPTSTDILRRRFEQLQDDSTLLVPRGMVFHIPPANVDTLFVYSWILSALAGNSNLVRLSARRPHSVNILLSLIAAALVEFPQTAARMLFLSYNHNDDISRLLSQHCDVRVIWGGNATVDQLRALRLPPHATEMTFPDRFSIAALNASSVLELNDPDALALAERLANDVYWFDQMGCASPRILLWTGSPDDANRAGERFYPLLAASAHAMDYSPDIGLSINKLNFSYRAAADGLANLVRFYGNKLTVLRASGFDAARIEFYGAGTLFEFNISSLHELKAFATRRDQTLVHFGYEHDELVSVAREINGRGFDRLVPVGQALAFGPVWDGFDLLSEFSRRVTIQST